MKTWQWLFAAGVAISFAAIGSIAEARIVRAQGEVPTVGVDRRGNLDTDLEGVGIGKLTISTRSRRMVARVRGTAPNYSRRTFRARTRDVNLVAPLINDFALDAFGFTFTQRFFDDLGFRRAYYRVSRRGSVYGVARARSASELIDFVVGLIEGDSSDPSIAV